MSQEVQDLLKKIQYIEADIEIQKQILHAIPTKDEQELERVIKIIAGRKEEITQLRSKIQKVDPVEYGKLLRLENGVNTFKRIAAEKTFVSIESKTIENSCLLYLKDNSVIDCLFKAREENGDHTIMTLDGEIQHFKNNSVLKE